MSINRYAILKLSLWKILKKGVEGTVSTFPDIIAYKRIEEDSIAMDKMKN